MYQNQLLCTCPIRAGQWVLPNPLCPTHSNLIANPYRPAGSPSIPAHFGAFVSYPPQLVGKELPTVDLDQPLIGFRAWTVHCNYRKERLGPFSPERNIPTGTVLRSVAMHHAWQTGRSLAKCGVITKKRHKAPQVDCLCGFYAFKDPLRARKYGAGAYGAVLLSGKVIEHGDGYRAQYARILCLVNNDISAAFYAKEHNVPLVSAEGLIPYCSEFGIIMKEDQE